MWRISLSQKWCKNLCQRQFGRSLVSTTNSYLHISAKNFHTCTIVYKIPNLSTFISNFQRWIISPQWLRQKEGYLRAWSRVVKARQQVYGSDACENAIFFSFWRFHCYQEFYHCQAHLDSLLVSSAWLYTEDLMYLVHTWPNNNLDTLIIHIHIKIQKYY